MSEQIYTIPNRIVKNLRLYPELVMDEFTLPNENGVILLKLVEGPTPNDVIIGGFNYQKHVVIKDKATGTEYELSTDENVIGANQFYIWQDTYKFGYIRIGIGDPNKGRDIQIYYNGIGSIIRAEDINEITSGDLIKDGAIKGRHFGITLRYDGSIGLSKDPNLAYKLDINGNVNIDGSLYVGQKIYQGDTAIEIQDTGDGNIKFIEDGSEVLRINNGNVGIGTTNPSYKLDVAGDINITGQYLINNQPLSFFKIYQGDSKVEVVDTGDGYISFTEDNTEVMRITGGSVGIGTTTPITNLDVAAPPLNKVYSTAAVFHLSGIQNWGSVVSLQTDNTNGSDESRLLFNYRNGAKYWSIGGYNSDYQADTFNIWEDANGGWGTQRLTILPGGNVGIGTTAPLSLLDVNGTAQLRGSAGGTGLYVDSNGSVGIGIANPKTKLHVVGDIQQDLPSTDPSYTGTVIYSTAGENISVGQVCRIGSDGKYYLANATSESTIPAIVLAVQNISAGSSGKFLVNGQWKSSSLSLTVGGYIYVSTTAGGITQTAPSVSGNVVQVIGITNSTTSFIFNPDIITIVIA